MVHPFLINELILPVHLPVQASSCVVLGELLTRLSSAMCGCSVFEMWEIESGDWELFLHWRAPPMPRSVETGVKQDAVQSL